jgi:predicted permease
LFAYSFNRFNLAAGGEARFARGNWVSGEYFSTLGVRPLAGRTFTSADDKRGCAPTAVLSYEFWKREYGGAPVLGRIVSLDTHPVEIIGVIQPGFHGVEVGQNVDIYVPLCGEGTINPENSALNKRSNWWLAVVGRPKPGMGEKQVLARLNTIAPEIFAATLPTFLVGNDKNEYLSRTFELLPAANGFSNIREQYKPALLVLMAVVGVVLLIACANVANLLLVRAESRQQELAIRAALGAGWGRIAGEMLLESLTLSVLGGALGLALANAALRILVAQGPATLPRLGEIGIDPLVLGFTLVVSLLAGFFFGLIPAIKYAGPQVASGLRGGGRTMSHGRERHRARNTLVVAQVGLALVLLIGSGLMIRTFQALRSVQPGFTHPEQVQLMRISIPDTQVKEPERAMRMENDMLDKLAAIPGVASVGWASAAPLEGINQQSDLLYARDKTYSPGQIPPVRGFRYISPGFLKTGGTPFIAGRDFTWTDVYDKRHVAMVSENLARELWGSPAAALGKQIRSGLQNDEWREVVGVVADVYDNGVDQKAPSFAYWPAMLDHFELDAVHVTRYGVFVIRSNRAGTENFLAEARKAIWSVDASVPVFRVRTLKDVYDESMARTSFTLVLLAIAGAMALVLGVVGIYGVIAYAVTQRTREIGIRMALGAQPAGLQRMFVRQGLLLAAVGAVLGLVAAAGLTRLMSSLLFKTAALDPVTYAAVSAVLILAAALASYFPARRATAVDPVEALRTE